MARILVVGDTHAGLYYGRHPQIVVHQVEKSTMHRIAVEGLGGACSASRIRNGRFGHVVVIAPQNGEGQVPIDAFVRALCDARAHFDGRVRFWIRGCVAPDTEDHGAAHACFHEALRCHAEEAGIGYIPSPPWAEDPEKHTLRWEYSDGDGVHIGLEHGSRAAWDLLDAIGMAADGSADA